MRSYVFFLVLIFLDGFLVLRFHPVSFKRELNFAIDEVKEITTQDWRRSVNEAFLSVILKTPVDTGVALNSWFSNLGNNNGGEGERSPSTSGSDSIAAMQATVSKSELGGQALLYNNLPYIERLEDGYSLQAPVGMVKTTLADWPQIVARNTRG